MSFNRLRKSIGAIYRPREFVGATAVFLCLICSALPAAAGERGSATMELFGSRISVGGGSTTRFDIYRQVECRPAKGAKASGGFRAGAPLSGHFGLEYTIRMLPGPYDDTLRDSRIPPPDPSEQQYNYFDEGLAFINDISLIYRYPIANFCEPYLVGGIGYMIGNDEVSGPVYNAGFGLILYPIPKIGIRFDTRFSGAKISGYLQQAIPRRAIPFRSKLTFTEFNIGLIARISPPASMR
jgi:hypothetical protein